MNRTRLAKARIMPSCTCAALLLAGCLTLGCGSGLYAGPETTSGTAVAATNGPQLGYFWNQADQTLRPVLGMAGASQVGASVVTAGEYTFGAGSPASGMAVLQETDGSLDVMTLPSGTPVHLNASTAPGALIRFSPAGRAALVFAPGASTAAVITALTTNPALTIVNASGALQDAAVSDAGHLALVVSSAPAAGPAGARSSVVQAVVPGGATHTVGSVSSPGGLAFASGDTLVYADGVSGSLFSAQNVSSAPAITGLPTGSLLKAPSTLSVDSAGRWAVVSNSGESSVVRIDLTGQNTPLRLPCGCTPSAAVALAGSGVFRITEPNAGPLWAADVAAATPRIFFIPALP